ncbi:YncE family protein [Lacinutrix gracilariae]|uniref:YncE family protein n=1 Tax=Lacinutrix gracilariae TaxID=1747198 RepID=A0ABW5K1U5_9FLAO
MKKQFKFLAFTLFFGLLITSCSNDDDSSNGDTNLGDYDNGYFVLNEGNGNPATASITFVGDDGIIVEDVFRLVNPAAEEIGSYLQDIFFDDTRAFIISGSANQVTVVNRYTFEYIATINTNFSAPRYGTVENGKAYVTNSADWSTGTDDFLTIIDLNDYSTTTMIVGDYSEKITSDDDYVYISNGYYGSGNAVTVLNTNTQELTSIDLGVGNSPNSIIEEDDDLYLLSYDYASNGKIFKINTITNTIENTIDLPASLVGAKNLVIEDDTFYFTVDASVYSASMSSTTISDTALLTYNSTSTYGVMYGFNVEDEKIYISDGGDFNSNSNVYEYALNGTLLNTITVGVGPNSFHFN